MLDGLSLGEFFDPVSGTIDFYIIKGKEQAENTAYAELIRQAEFYDKLFESCGDDHSR